MSDLQFMKYQTTPGEKHLGVATILYKGCIILRYKAIQTKDGQGIFFAPASLKVQDEITKEDKFVESFMIDSRFENEEIQNFVRSNVKAWYQQNNVANQSTKPKESDIFGQQCPF